jgi:RNA polymerase sigma factor (sigma-70 family)
MSTNEPSPHDDGKTRRHAPHDRPSERLLALILRAQQGELAAEHELFAQLAPMIRSALAPYQRDSELYEELQDEAYVILHGLVLKFDPARKVNVWIFIQRNLGPAAKSYARQQQEVARRERRWSELRTEGAPTEDDERAGPEENIERQIRKERGRQEQGSEVEQQTVLRLTLRQALDRLPPCQRAVVLLRAQGCSFKEIAAALGMNEPNCRRTFARAQNRLRRVLGKDL